jgi:hypothetical protein
MPYRQFRTHLRRLITSPILGEDPGYQRPDGDEQGPANRELRKSKAFDTFVSDEFCMAMYTLSQEHRQLEIERHKVLQIARRMRPAIQRYRSATQYLKSCAQKVGDCDRKYCDLIDSKSARELNSVRCLLENLADAVEQRGRLLVSNIHPAKRKYHDTPSDWILLFNLHNYPLERLNEKAVDQWFYVCANRVIQEFIKRKSLPKISDMTRFKIIAAVCSVAINVNVGPGAIKEYFDEHPQS